MPDNARNLAHHSSLKHNTVTASIANLLLRPLTRNVEAYIFVATTGRSGTASLEKILAAVNGCITFHEVYPKMNEEVMAAYNNNNPELAMKMYNFVKSINIKRASVGHRYYAETNHTFIKSFIDFAIDDLQDRLRIIHLIRNPVDVATSMINLGHQPGTAMGNRWYIDIHAAKNIILLGDVLENHKEFSHPFYRALWYWYEIESRVQYWKNRATPARFFELLTDDLNDKNKLFKFLDDMNIAYDPDRIARVATTRANRKLSVKQDSGLNRQQAIDMQKRFETLLTDRGFEIPHSVSYF